jgi:hypothetical protein
VGFSISFKLSSFQIHDPFLAQICSPSQVGDPDEHVSFTLPPYDGSPCISLNIPYL